MVTGRKRGQKLPSRTVVSISLPLADYALFSRAAGVRGKTLAAFVRDATRAAAEGVIRTKEMLKALKEQAA